MKQKRVNSTAIYHEGSLYVYGGKGDEQNQYLDSMEILKCKVGGQALEQGWT